jgi:hypothetical protein
MSYAETWKIWQASGSVSLQQSTLFFHTVLETELSFMASERMLARPRG